MKLFAAFLKAAFWTFYVLIAFTTILLTFAGVANPWLWFVFALSSGVAAALADWSQPWWNRRHPSPRRWHW